MNYNDYLNPDGTYTSPNNNRIYKNKKAFISHIHSKKTHRMICFLYHKHECIICGENRIIDVHHFDENKNNNDPSNLIPLCPNHHRFLHSKYKLEFEKIVIEYINNHVIIE